MRYLLLACMLVGAVCATSVDVAAASRGATGASSADSAVYRFLEDSPTGAFDLSATVRAQGAGEARLCFGYRSAQDYYSLRLTNRSVTLFRVIGGKAAPLAPPHALQTPLGAEPVLVLIKRRPEKIGVALRGIQLMTVGNLDAGQGKVGTSASGGLQIEAPRVQMVEAPAFTDDFMREAGEPSPWEAALGQWSAATVGDVKKSANGFSYRGAGTPALSVTGYTFWDDYALQASVNCAEEEGTFGLCLYLQDPKNYLGVQWSSAEGLCLVRVVDGARTVLARKALAWIPRQWYRLGVQALDGHLAAMVDGKVVLEASDISFTHGKVALYTSGKEVFFDDVAVKPAVYFHQPSPLAHRAAWLSAGGVQVAGSIAWQDYTYRARFTPTDRGGLGMVFGWRDPKDYYLFTWNTARKQLVRVAGGQRSVLAEAPGGYLPKKSYEVAASFRPGYAAIAIDGKSVLESSDPRLSHGAVGLSPLTASVQDVAVTLREEPPPPEEEITKEFTISSTHPDMAEWANPAKAWMPRMADNGIVFWRKGVFFGDTSVRIPIPQMGASGRIHLALGADGKDPLSGYTFTIERPETGKVAVELLRQDKPLAKATAAVAGDQPPILTLARQGAFLVADLDGKRILEQPAAPSPHGTSVGLRVRDVEMDLKEIQVRSRNVYDYTFHDAPIDWARQSGIWEITNRWSCSPGWSWFGGRDERLAAIWSKRRFTGDLVLEYYAGPKMDAVAEAYTERFRDLNCTICGDGTRLNSGYTFIIDGWHLSPQGRRTAILRGTRVVAENQTFHLPPQKTAHHQWFYIRVEKRGNRLSLSVDNEQLLTWEDPEPLTGDRIALWTQNNGMMLARAVVSYEHEEPITLVARAPGKPAAQTDLAPPPAKTSLPLVNDFEAGLEHWRGVSTRLVLDANTASHGKKSLQIINAVPGGEFKTVAVPAPFDVTQASLLSFDYRVPHDAHVNLYARVGTGQSYYAIGFTGQGQINPAYGVIGSLGKIEGIEADDKWHHATFDLLAALRRYFPNDNPLTVNELFFANWDAGDEYIQAGVTDNGIGTRYHIDRFCLGSKEGTLTTQPSGTQTAAPKSAVASTKPPKPARRLSKPAVAHATAPKRAPGATGRTRTVALGPGKPMPPLPAPAAGQPKPQKPAARRSLDPRIALADSFTPGKSPVRWEPMDGKWAVNAKGQFAPTAKPEYAYALAGEPTWSDYIVKADLVHGQDAGLCLRAQDWNNCVFVAIRPAHRDLFWFVRRNGEWGGILALTALETDVKPLTHVKVVVSGDVFQCYLDGKLVSQIKDDTFRHGRAGLYIHPAEAGQAWDNVEVLLSEPPGGAPQAVARKK